MGNDQVNFENAKIVWTVHFTSRSTSEYDIKRHHEYTRTRVNWPEKKYIYQKRRHVSTEISNIRPKFQMTNYTLVPPTPKSQPPDGGKSSWRRDRSAVIYTSCTHCRQGLKRWSITRNGDTKEGASLSTRVKTVAFGHIIRRPSSPWIYAKLAALTHTVNTRADLSSSQDISLQHRLNTI